MKDWIIRKVYHWSFAGVRWACNRSPFHKAVLLAEAQIMVRKGGVPPGVTAAAYDFILALRDHNEGT
jgi:hypothetical protein